MSKKKSHRPRYKVSPEFLASRKAYYGNLMTKLYAKNGEKLSAEDLERHVDDFLAQQGIVRDPSS